MKRVLNIACMTGALIVLLGSVGCATRAPKVGQLRLGDTPGDVIMKMGEPTSVRAARKYAEDDAVEVWEYQPPLVTLYPKTYWVYFQNGSLVQWGEPGDFTGSASGAGAAIPSFERKPAK